MQAALQEFITSAHQQATNLEAGGTVEELDYMSNTGFGGLRKPRFKSLDYKEDQNLPGKSRSIFQSQQHQL